MQDEQIKRLAVRLARTGSFVKPQPSFFARRWFSERTIRQVVELDPSLTSEDEIKYAALSKIGDALDIVKSKIVPRDKTLKDKEKARRRWKNRSLIQIVYGALASHPEFYEDEFASFLDLTIRRRYRLIERMRYVVNPSSLGYFRYPSANSITLNPDAAPYWNVNNGRLTALGRANPRDAIEKVFVEPTQSANMVYCLQAANLLHFDSLLTVEDPDSVLNQLVAMGEEYITFFAAFQEVLAITTNKVEPSTNITVNVENTSLYLVANRPYLIVGNREVEQAMITAISSERDQVTFDQLTKSYEAGAMIWFGLPFTALSDPRLAYGWFEERLIDVDDLQVGDHVYLTNHPLYLHMVPDGAWSGEHSFVMRRWRMRNPKTKPDSGEVDPLPWDKETITVQGHGMRTVRLEVATNALLKELNKAIVAAVRQLKNKLKQDPNLTVTDIEYKGKTTTLLRNTTKQNELISAGHPVEPFHCWYVPYPVNQEFYLFRLDPPVTGTGRQKARGFLKVNRLRFRDLSRSPLFRQGSLISAKVYVRRPRVAPFI
jgi:hypothetical protein